MGVTLVGLDDQHVDGRAMSLDGVPRLVGAAAVHQDRLEVHVRLAEDGSEAALERAAGVEVGDDEGEAGHGLGSVGRRRRVSTK